MSTTKPFEFEKALKELEEITVWFESSDVDLDAGLVKFERGMELAQQLKSHLAGVENRVEKIKQRFSGTTPGAPAPADVDALAAPAPDTAADDDLPPLSDDDAPTDQANLFRA
jgi:exodeoxyribonuclease VII small subunit